MANKQMMHSKGPKSATELKPRPRPVVATVDGVSRSDDSSKSIIVAAVVVLLVLSGIGFLILGLAQSMQGNGKTNNNSQTVAQNTDNTKSDDNKSEGSLPVDNSGSQTNNKPDSNMNQPETNKGTAVNSMPSFVTKYVQTNVRNSRGNTYLKGSITGNSYVVKEGDTLYQIAQGRYGAGDAWIEINNANGGFKNLPNGKPNLIIPGYNLVLPN